MLIISLYLHDERVAQNVDLIWSGFGDFDAEVTCLLCNRQLTPHNKLQLTVKFDTMGLWKKKVTFVFLWTRSCELKTAMRGTCKITETVSGVNQIRTRRHAHVLEYLQLPWKPSWRSETSHVTFLSFYLLASLSSPSLPLLYLALYLSVYLTLSIYDVLCHRSPFFSLGLFVRSVFFFCLQSNKEPFSKDDFWIFFLPPIFFIYFILTPSTDTFLSSSATSFLLFIPLHTSWNNAVPVSWCNIVQTVRNPLENSPRPSKTATKCNPAGVTEVRLRRSHFSTGRMSLVFPDSEPRPSKRIGV